ncbi:MAG: NAD(P)/FAD-dependent oxidoreductase [Bacillota bacterium]
MSYVIIGNSAAAVGAVEGIRQVDGTGPITIISQEPYHTYSRPLISYYLSGKVAEETMYYRSLDFYERHHVETMLGREATGIDVGNRQVIINNAKRVNYDQLLIATGGKPFIPPLQGLDKGNIFTFIKLDDVKKIQEVAGKGRRGIIIGAGLIGLKAAEALNILGVELTVVELANRVLSAILDEEAAGIVQGHLEARGIQFQLETTVEKVLGENSVSGVVLQNGQQLPCDFLIVAIGVVPNTGVVRDTPVKVNRGIVVDDRMRTNVEGIYAAGDVAEGYDVIFGAPRVLPILPGAYCQGETAGKNMAGQVSVYAGGFAMNSIGFFGLPMATAGMIRPDSGDYEVHVSADAGQKTYRKIVLKDNVLTGFITLNRIDRSGILTGLIRDRINVEVFKARLLEENLGYIDFPQELRNTRLLQGGVAR